MTIKVEMPLLFSSPHIHMQKTFYPRAGLAIMFEARNKPKSLSTWNYGVPSGFARVLFHPLRTTAVVFRAVAYCSYQGVFVQHSFDDLFSDSKFDFSSLTRRTREVLGEKGRRIRELTALVASLRMMVQTWSDS